VEESGRGKEGTLLEGKKGVGEEGRKGSDDE